MTFWKPANSWHRRILIYLLGSWQFSNYMLIYPYLPRCQVHMSNVQRFILFVCHRLKLAAILGYFSQSPALHSIRFVSLIGVHFALGGYKQNHLRSGFEDRVDVSCVTEKWNISVVLSGQTGGLMFDPRSLSLLFNLLFKAVVGFSSPLRSKLQSACELPLQNCMLTLARS